MSTSCTRCFRLVDDEDLVTRESGMQVCEPCSVEMSKAEDRRDSIDAAWAAAEATRGYRVVELREIPPGDELPVALWFAAARRGDEPKPCATGRSAVEALRQLAAKIDEDG